MSRVFYWGQIGAKGLRSDEPALIASYKTIENEVSNITPILGVNIIKASAGNSFLLLLDDKGFVYSFGIGKNCRLGNGDESDQFLTPIRVKALQNVTDLSAGYWTGCCISSKNVMIWGKLCNKVMKLPLAWELPKEEEPVSIYSGNNYCAALTSLNHLYFVGSNSYSKCGFQNVQELEKLTPLIINSNGESITEFKAVSLGFNSTLVITMRGEVFGFGSNDNYQLGIGNQRNKNGHMPTKLIFNSPTNIVNISCTVGSSHNCHGACVDDEGNLYTFGSGYKYKLGTGNTNDQMKPILVQYGMEKSVKEVICGGIHTLALIKQNSLVSFGCGSDGRLGHKEVEGHRYLYKEEEPRMIEKLGYTVANAYSSYYFGIAICIDGK
ncbi:hypothetical protein ABK040_011541 [Willaertia magna]